MSKNEYKNTIEFVQILLVKKDCNTYFKLKRLQHIF